MKTYTPAQMRRARNAAKRMLVELGVTARYRAFHPLAESIAMVAGRPYLIDSPKSNLYPEVIKSLGLKCTPAYLEKDMDRLVRRLFAKALDKCPEKIHQYYGAVFDPELGRMTIGDFIACTAVEVDIKIQMMRSDY